MKRGTLLLMAMVLLFMCQAQAMAGEMDILVRKLVEHGVLTQQDADEILQETRVEAEKERQETIAATKEALMTGEDAPFMLADAVPSFIRNTKIKGDFRLRYQHNDREGGNTNRNRGRYRLRVGFVTKINEKVDVGFGFATGDGNPRSANDDMNNTFENPGIRLDLSYASYKPFDWLTLVGGKFKNPLWLPGSSFLWDSDIKPEGISMSINRTFGGVEFFMNNGFWILGEFKDDSDDPFMWVMQPGYKVALGDQAYFKNALTVYQFSNVKGNDFKYSSGSNTRNPDLTYAKDYDAVVVSGEVGYKTGLALIPNAALFSEYIHNTSTSSKNNGYIVGFKFGHAKVKKPRQWQATMHYQRLEKDAWLDTFPNADVYSGETNTESYVLNFAYGLMDKISLGANYYHSLPLTGPSDDDDVFQLDLLIKF
jgi:hypothetical protein